ncbi:Uncharacterised protein [Vibrio cholerae]|nr:Uncharacterised protein [Vibrio cholerae]
MINATLRISKLGGSLATTDWTGGNFNPIKIDLVGISCHTTPLIKLERDRCFLMVFDHLVVTCGGFHREFNFRKLQIVRPIHVNTRSRGCCHRGTR